MKSTRAVAVWTMLLWGSGCGGSVVTTSSKDSGAQDAGAGGSGGSAGQGGGGGGAAGSGGASGSGGGGMSGGSGTGGMSGGGGGGAGGGGMGGGGGGGTGGSGGSDASLPTLPYGCGILGNCPTDTSPYPMVRPFSNGKELCAWINSCRVAYSFHARCGGIDSDDPCTPNAAATWPFAMKWDATAGAEAQAEADRIAKGGAPSGKYFENSLDSCNTMYSSFGLWTEGLSTSRYMVTGKDVGAAWSVGGGGCSSLGKHLAYFRTGLAYVDSCTAPKLAHIGCGVADAGGGDVWGVIVMVP